MADSDRLFTGSIPDAYDSYLVPLIFEDYAADLVARLRTRNPSDLLEIAAGSGVVTRAMASGLDDALIVATDLNQEMLDQGAAVGTSRPVEWRQADALDLPFPDGSFDAVVCQFGVMFFPDKPRAFAEARRVLRPGGVFVFNTWHRIEDNEFADEVESGVASMFPDDPPRFLSRIPYGYFEPAVIENDLGSPAEFETVTFRSRAPSPAHPAIGFCEGTPLRNEIEARSPSGVGPATAAAAARVGERFGNGPVESKMQAHVVTVR